MRNLRKNQSSQIVHLLSFACAADPSKHSTKNRHRSPQREVVKKIKKKWFSGKNCRLGSREARARKKLSVHADEQAQAIANTHQSIHKEMHHDI